MLTVKVPGTDYFDTENEQFVKTDDCILQLEHSLVSISKWESIWHKPFLSRTPMTYAETISYIQCMTLNDVEPTVYLGITNDIIEEISEYIDDPMTATTIKSMDAGRPTNEIITSEIIYYSMIALNIPSCYETWHLNRLLTLIAVCKNKNSPGKKMSKQAIFEQNRLLNEQRKAKYKTKG